MNIDVHIHFPPSPTQPDVSQVLAAIEGPIGLMVTAIERLTQEVAQSRTVTEGAVAFISGIPGMIRGAIADEAALNALADDLDSQQKVLADALTANTVAATETPAPAPAREADTLTGGDATSAAETDAATAAGTQTAIEETDSTGN